MKASPRRSESANAVLLQSFKLRHSALHDLRSPLEANREEPNRKRYRPL
jgi:hypothetical protein